MQVLGSDVRFAAAHSTAGARSRESRGSGSPSSAEPRIGVSRSPSPPAAERSPSLPPSPPLLHPLSQTPPPRPPTPRCPGWRLGRPPPGPTSSRSLSRFRPRFFLLLTRSSWGQDPLSSCRLCHHLLLRGTWPPQGLSPGLSTRLSPKRRHDPTGPLAQTHGGFPQPLDVGTGTRCPGTGRRRGPPAPTPAPPFSQAVTQIDAVLTAIVPGAVGETEAQGGQSMGTGWAPASGPCAPHPRSVLGTAEEGGPQQ